jgi:hypothetical protein
VFSVTGRRIVGESEKPLLSTSYLTHVKQLPETDITLLIIPDSNDGTIASRRSLTSVRVYRTIAVNMNRFDSGKRTKVFE